VIVVGLDQSQESEGHDRTITGFPGVQSQFITAVAGSAKGPVIVVVMAGGSVDLTLPKNADNIGAILWVGYPGQSGGQALADIIFGTVNPSGRMPYTVFTSDLPNEVNFEDMGMRPNGTVNPGRTYRFYTGSPVYEFGDGLSYTTFQYSSTNNSLTVDSSVVSEYAKRANGVNFIAPVPSSKLYTPVGDLQITVKNNGTVAGAVSVLAFLVPPNPGKNGAPLRYLIGFDKTFLEPGQQQTFDFPVQAHDLTLVDADGMPRVETGTWHLQINQGDLFLPIYVTE